MVGAGSSARVGYVTWDGLMKELEDLAIECGKDFDKDDLKRKEQPLEYAEDIKSHIAREARESGDLSQYFASLDELFAPKKYLDNGSQFHKTLVALPFKGILTTNYDVVLEDALEAIGKPAIHKNSFVVNKNTAGQVHRFFLTMSDPDKIGVAHLHGIYNDPERIILSSKDYEDAYGPPIIQEISKLNFFQKFWHQMRREENSDWTLHRKFLWAVLATRRVVFVGFSMKDPYFNKMLESVSNDLWRWGRPVHFAIMSISPKESEALQTKHKAERFKRHYGIETLFYLDIDGKHQGLEDIIYGIAEELGVSVPSDTTPPDLPSESEDELDKVKQMSQSMEGKISHEN